MIFLYEGRLKNISFWECHKNIFLIDLQQQMQLDTYYFI